MTTTSAAVGLPSLLNGFTSTARSTLPRLISQFNDTSQKFCSSVTSVAKSWTGNTTSTAHDDGSSYTDCDKSESHKPRELTEEQRKGRRQLAIEMREEAIQDVKQYQESLRHRSAGNSSMVNDTSLLLNAQRDSTTSESESQLPSFTDNTSNQPRHRELSALKSSLASRHRWKIPGKVRENKSKSKRVTWADQSLPLDQQYNDTENDEAQFNRRLQRDEPSASEIIARKTPLYSFKDLLMDPSESIKVADKTLEESFGSYLSGKDMPSVDDLDKDSDEYSEKSLAWCSQQERYQNHAITEDALKEQYHWLWKYPNAEHLASAIENGLEDVTAGEEWAAQKCHLNMQGMGTLVYANTKDQVKNWKSIITEDSNFKITEEEAQKYKKMKKMRRVENELLTKDYDRIRSIMPITSTIAYNWFKSLVKESESVKATSVSEGTTEMTPRYPLITEEEMMKHYPSVAEYPTVDGAEDNLIGEELTTWANERSEMVGRGILGYVRQTPHGGKDPLVEENGENTNETHSDPSTISVPEGKATLEDLKDLLDSEMKDHERLWTVQSRRRSKRRSRKRLPIQ